ncbi:calcium-binding protein [Nocardioides sp. NPDC126508]
MIRRWSPYAASVLLAAAALTWNVPASAQSVPTCDGSIVTVNLATGDAPTEGDDVILGTAEADVIDGRAGDDIVCGDDGADTIRGGPGNDKIFGGAGDDRSRDGGGNDHVDLGAGKDQVSYEDATTGVSVALSNTDVQNTGGGGADSLVGVENILGTSYEDVLTASPAGSDIDGRGGADVVYSGIGYDRFHAREGLVISYELATAAAHVDGGRSDPTVWVEGEEADAIVPMTVQDRISLAGTRLVLTGYGDGVSAGAFCDVDARGGADVVFSTATSLLGGSWFCPAGTTVRAGDGDDRLEISWRPDLSTTLPVIDTFDGGSGQDSVDFSRSDRAVTYNAGDGTRTYGGQTITTISTEGIIGSAYADVLTGDARNNRIAGELGNDRISGGAGDDTILGNGRLDAANDNDVLSGDAGADMIVGDGGTDTVSYATASGAVRASLSGATGAAGTDTIRSVENLTGSGHADILSGNSASNVINGGGGNDTLAGGGQDDRLIGGSGTDTASYATASAGVTATLSKVQGSDDTDTLSQVENLTGSRYADILVGSSGANVLLGGAGNDRIRPGLGNDRVDGGSGFDIVSYAAVTRAVKVSLARTTAQSTGGAGAETLRGVEGLIGTSRADALTGNAAANRLEGGPGDDRLYGAAGPDRIYGGTGRDYGDGGLGRDWSTSVERRVRIP